MKKLKVGDKVIAIFLGSERKCEVVEVHKSSNTTYKLNALLRTKKTGAGTLQTRFLDTIQQVLIIIMITLVFL